MSGGMGCRYQALTRERDLLNSRWDEQNNLLVQSHERVIQDLTEEYEQKLQEEQVLPAATIHTSVLCFHLSCLLSLFRSSRSLLPLSCVFMVSYVNLHVLGELFSEPLSCFPSAHAGPAPLPSPSHLFTASC